MFPQNQILNQMRRRRVFEPPFATPPIALQEEAEQSKSDPWSERLPDGRTVNEAIMATLQREQALPGDINAPQAHYRGAALGSSQQDPRVMAKPIGDGRYAERVIGEGGRIEGFGDDRDYAPLAGVNRSAIPAEVSQAAGIQRSTGMEGRPSIVGGSRNPNPLAREAQRIQTMIAHPSREVDAQGAAGVAHPIGRVKGALLGALFGLAQGDRGTSLAERLAAGGTGALIGGVKPRAVQDWQRRMEVEDAQSQLGQQMKLSAGQAQLENLRAETQSRMADLMMDPETGQIVKRPPRRAPQYVERSDGVYEISEAHPEGRRVGNIPAEVKARGRGSVHYENREDGVYAIYEDADGAIKSQRVEGVPGKASDVEDKRTANRAKREAKLNESSTYYKKADNLESQAAGLDEHIKKLEEGMKTLPEFAVSTSAVDSEGNPIQVPNPGREAHQKQINDLRKQQQDLRGEANKLRTDGDKARSEGESIPESAAPSTQVGRKWSASKWKAANPSGDVEAARTAAKAAGYQVVE